MMLAERKLAKKRFSAFIFCLFFIISNILPMHVHAEGSSLKVGGIYEGFKLKEDKELKEINSRSKVFEHVKSGAKLIYLENDDENMTFDINFVTPSSDNTGVNHVLEHSVLYGSDKYPVKSPIAEIEKHSVVSFVNAMTGMDRTQYPIITNNYKDFKNVVGIYMDAVFFPKFRNDERIFKTQAGYYGLESKEAEVTYNGVVYNEMKGIMANPNRVLSGKIFESLYPNSTYSWNSGGDPQCIPTLTYEKALEVYNRNYHPSNSYIYLYGKLNLVDILKKLDGDYLSKFNKKEISPKIGLPKPFDKRREVVAEYPITKGSDTKNKTFLSLNYAINLDGNREDATGLELLSQILLDGDSAPLKTALVENGFGATIQGGYMKITKKPVFLILSVGANQEDKGRFNKFVDDQLVKLSKDGLDKEFVKSIVNNTELSMRKDKTSKNKGLYYNDLIMNSWIYENDPTRYMENQSDLEKIKKSIDKGYFENLIRKYLVNNNHSSLVVVSGKPGLQDEIDEKIKIDLANYKANLSDNELEKMVAQTQQFKQWQNTPDSESSLDTIPKLNPSDVKTEAKTIPISIKDINDNKLVLHPMYTNKVSYMNFYFDTKTVPQDKLQYLYILSKVLGRLDTENYTQQQLEQKSLNIGNVNFKTTNIIDKNDSIKYSPKFIVTCESLTEKSKEVIDFADEIMMNTKFDSKNRMRAYIKELKEEKTQYLNTQQASIAMNRLYSYLSPVGQYSNVFNLEIYSFLCDLDKNFDVKYGELIKNLNDVSKLVFNRQNLVTSVAADTTDLSKVEGFMTDITNKLPNEKLDINEYKFDNLSKNEGLIYPGQGQYVVKGCDINKLGYKYTGKMLVLQKILESEYLTPAVRERGGAYGSTFQITSDGIAMFSSWRDPNLKQTLETYNKAGDFLRDFKISQEKLTSYILGIVNSNDQGDVYNQVYASDISYIGKCSEEQIKKRKEEALSTTPEDIIKFADLMDAIAKDKTYCIVGSSDKIDENKEIFNQTRNLLE